MNYKYVSILKTHKPGKPVTLLGSNFLFIVELSAWKAMISQVGFIPQSSAMDTAPHFPVPGCFTECCDMNITGSIVLAFDG